MATMTATAPASTAQRKLPVRPYKDFLTPALHRRFTNAALLGLAACWVEATLMSSPSLFWSWFPFGFTGLRTLLLFVACLTVYILRVAQLHVGERNTVSSFDTFWHSALSHQAIQTCTWYAMSAFLFCEVYIFSTGESANLGWVDPGRSYERARLNERPVIFRSLFFCLAIARAAVHLARDDDQLMVPSAEAEILSRGGDMKEQGRQQIKSSPLQKMQASAGQIVQRSLTLTIVTSFIGPSIYFLALRRPAWALAHSIGKVFFKISKYTNPSGLTDVFALFGRFAIASFLLVLLWEITNHAFSFCASEEPLKKGQPLTSDSKDPNGTLIAGLKARKELPRSMAFWELALISTRFEERRKTLYQESDRQGGSTWSQICSACLSEIQRVNQRIQGPQQPPTQTAGQSTQAAPAMPRISQPLRQDNIVNGQARPQSTMDAIVTGVGAMAKSVGQSPGANPVKARAQKMLEYSTEKVRGQNQQQNKPSLSQQANQYISAFLRSPIGSFFQQALVRRLKSIIFGSPNSHASNIHHAVRALSQLTVSSLKEDRLGLVAKDVASIVRVFSSTISNIQNMVQTLQPHSSDVAFDGKRQVKEVEDLLRELRGGLEKIVLSFGEYADGVGLTKTDLRMAKEAVGKQSEMAVASK